MSNKAGLYQGKRDDNLEAIVDTDEDIELADDEKSFYSTLIVKVTPICFSDPRSTYRENVLEQINKAQDEMLELFMEEYDKRNESAPASIASDR